MKYAALVLLAITIAVPLKAATLQEALKQAYDSNPTLQRQRAVLRETDEGVALAKSGTRPSIDADASIGRAYNSVSGLSGTFTPRGVGVSLTQPVYKGGSIAAGISAAERTVLAQRAQLESTEQSMFLSVAQSYFDVARDQSVLRLNRKNEDVLGKERGAVNGRLKAGEATKTDSSQSESRLAGATADRVQAEGRLAISQAGYLRVVGAPAGDVEFPKSDIKLPATLDEAIGLAQNNNPLVLAARYSEEASRDDVNVAEGALLPQVNINASAGRDWDQDLISPGQADSAIIEARLTLPLYRAGADYARTRAAKEAASQRRLEVREAMDQSRQQIVSAWQNLNAARVAIGARQKQIKAAEQALIGVREESNAGTRTVLDRLNAEAEMVQSQVDLVQAQHDEMLAMFQVKAAIGELTAEKLSLPVEIYNPQQHYDHVKDKWIGTGVEEVQAAPQPISMATPIAAVQPAKPDEKPFIPVVKAKLVEDLTAQSFTESKQP